VATEVLRDPGGAPCGRFVVRRLGGESMAEGLAAEPGVSPDRVAEAALGALPGWFASTDDLEVGLALERAGAQRRRLAHILRLDLRAAPPPAAAPPPGIELAPLTGLTSSLVLSSVAAYPSGHPDHAGHRAATAHRSLGRILDGHEVGPLLACSRVALHAGHAVGAAVLTRSADGPWLAELFRAPGRHLRGTGRALLAASLDAARADGIVTLGLAVTEGNDGPRALYESFGFEFIASGLTVRIPARVPA
jgi:GNAT superfamily N-acetyltransferase